MFKYPINEFQANSVDYLKISILTVSTDPPFPFSTPPLQTKTQTATQ